MSKNMWVICKNCRRQVINPTTDRVRMLENGKLEIQCEHCFRESEYTNDEIHWPEDDRGESVKLLRSQVSKLEEKVSELEAQVKEKDRLLSEEIGKLVSAYMTLADFVHNKANQNQGQDKGTVSYEGTNPD